MKKIGLILLCVAAYTTPAAAVITEQNDPAIIVPVTGFVTGLGNLTYDSSTNLQWLDITISKNLSYNDIVGGGLFPGFRYATDSEVQQFWQNAGIQTPNNNVAEDSTAINSLLGIWGITYQAGTIIDEADALTALSTSAGTHEFAVLSARNGFLDYAMSDAGVRSDNLQDPFIGSALVREVPEPSSLVLGAILGVTAGVVAFRRRKAA